MARKPPQLRRVGFRDGPDVDSNGGALRQEPPAGGGDRAGGRGIEQGPLCLLWDSGNLGAISQADEKDGQLNWAGFALREWGCWAELSPVPSAASLHQEPRKAVDFPGHSIVSSRAQIQHQASRNPLQALASPALFPVGWGAQMLSRCGP